VAGILCNGVHSTRNLNDEEMVASAGCAFQQLFLSVTAILANMTKKRIRNIAIIAQWTTANRRWWHRGSASGFRANQEVVERVLDLGVSPRPSASAGSPFSPRHTALFSSTTQYQHRIHPRHIDFLRRSRAASLRNGRLVVFSY